MGFTLFGDRRSGNCQKVIILAGHLGLDFDFVEMDILAGDAALDQMEHHLSARPWFVGAGPSLADLGLLPYTRLAPEGGFDLGPRSVVRAWIARAETAFSVALEA